MTNRFLHVTSGALMALAFSSAPVEADDWPMWRHDPGRTATSPDGVPELDKLTPYWTAKLPEPRPAYRDVRLGFDAGYEPIVLGKRLIVGSNVDDSVTAFDTRTGELLWKFFTNGPVRFAPVGDDERVIFGSDDGSVYCVSSADGTVVWRHRAVPSGRHVLGNGRLISVWPVRGGPVLQDGKVFFAAGVWPLEGTFVFCLDAENGKVIWRNDEAAYRYQVHPHNAEAYGGLAPQGYLLVDGEDLIVPSSQAYPARFHLQTGALKEFELPAPGRIPGGWFASTPAEKEEQRLRRRGLLFDDKVNVSPHEDKPRKEGLPEIRSTVRVGEAEFKFADGLPGVDGEIHSVIAGDGMLFVSTKDGALIALGDKGGAPELKLYDLDERRAFEADEAGMELPSDELPKNGYAMLLNVPDAGRIETLVSSTPGLQVIGIDGDSMKIDKLRRRGWNGHDVSFLWEEPSKIELPPYLASLAIIDETFPVTPETVRRYFESLRPFGGKMISRAPKLAKAAELAELTRASIRVRDDGWTVITREGQLEGAENYGADWVSNSDKRVKAPLGLLWYGDSITHFKRSPQPKFVDGVMISTPKNWTDSSTRKGGVDYRLLETVLSDVYTGRLLKEGEEPHVRKNYAEVDLEKIQPSQYRPPRQKDDWKPERPVVGDRVNPLTGETEPRSFPKSYGCDGGVDYGHMFSMRSGTPAFYDKRIESGTVNVSGPRSGCTNSIIPANGILNLPYFYEGCTCSYPLPVALALVSRPQQFEQWASWGTAAAEKLEGKIERIGLNFGAPGDRMTEDGTLWLDIPNVGGPSPEVKVTTKPALETLDLFYQHSLFLEGGSGWPWVAGSGVHGLRSVTVQGMKPGTYRVRITKLNAAKRAETTERVGLEVGEDGGLTVPNLGELGNVSGIEIVREGLESDPVFQK